MGQLTRPCAESLMLLLLFRLLVFIFVFLMELGLLVYSRLCSPQTHDKWWISYPEGYLFLAVRSSFDFLTYLPEAPNDTL